MIKEDSFKKRLTNNKVLSLILFCIQSINRQPLAAKKWHRSDIVFPMQHSDCNSFLADLLSPFNNASMIITYNECDFSFLDASLFFKGQL